MNGQVTIRELQVDDEFGEIRKLISKTYNRMNPTAYWGGTIDNIKSNLNSKTGFVAEENDKIVGFAGVQFAADTTDNGSIHYGFEEGYDAALAELIGRASSAAREKGGKKLVTHVVLNFGQVRNRIITILESLGFVADEYLTSSFNMDLSQWDAPEDFDNERIEPATDLQINEIKQILEEDGEDYLAKMFTTQFSIHPNYTRHNPDCVFLTLKDKDSNDIAGVAYYRVHIFKKDGVETFAATACGFHFRPKYNLDRKEKRRFLQGTYLSMKQLGIRRAISQMTFHQFDIFAAIAAEGFYSITSQNNSLLLTKTL